MNFKFVCEVMLKILRKVESRCVRRLHLFNMTTLACSVTSYKNNTDVFHRLAKFDYSPLNKFGAKLYQKGLLFALEVLLSLLH